MWAKTYLWPFFVTCCVLCSVFGIGLGQASLARAEGDLTSRIQGQYERIQGFQSQFVQVLTNAASKEKERRTGSIAFSQPRLIRWETKAPESELLIVGPDLVWDYFAAEDLAYKYGPEQILQSKTMLRFISGEANLAEDFQIQDQGQDQGWTKLKLIPKEPEPNLVLAYIWVEPETARLRQVLLIDYFRNQNRLTFNDIRINPEFEAGFFEFTPPPGTKVLKQTAPNQQGQGLGEP